MKTILLFSVGFVVIVSCMALDCPECQPELCKDPGPCRFGETRDVCGCCPACYKGPGEKCGGPWDVHGFCAKHLTCVKLPEEEHPDPIKKFNADGICLYLPK